MNRFHVHLNVADLEQNIRFYSQLFGAQPSVQKHDYAKWLLDDPQLNFAISTQGEAGRIAHLGFQVDSDQGLADIGARLKAAGSSVLPEDATVCCYAQSDKLWTEDPQGIHWESFHTFGEATTYFAAEAACATDGSSCTPDPAKMKPQTQASASCCAPASACC
ncbi:ArsI/CadI family heavy metal resistance metalloenzyme [Pseudomarimonas arenosa]|uniref:VOC family protein n=1 Tax=Pseudomarimonas arenosa TaxID=2774145 RepID=A0AAW3ZLV6_9GAMM|nr:ArsI/CadI family heavy metal resistance metalloenzyme [Pseudomarimonas arenosa]MBD8525629.1 VOC family protein [Pseudomarimonas arenosa]